MSMELYVLSNRRLPSMGAWQQAIDNDGFPLRLSAGRPILDLYGALPVKLKGKQTAFECSHSNPGESTEEFSSVALNGPWTYALALRWSGADIDAGIAAYFAASAYAKAVEGVLLDCEEDKIISSQRAAEIAQELEKSIPAIEEAVRKVMERFGNR